MPNILLGLLIVLALVAAGVLIGSLPIALIGRYLQRRYGWHELGALRGANAIWVAGTTLVLVGIAWVLAITSPPGAGVGIAYLFVVLWFVVSWSPLVGAQAAFQYLARRDAGKE